MGTGEIRDFTKPNPNPLPETTPTPQIRRLNKGQGVEVIRHETVVVEGDGKIRRPLKKVDDPEIRLRIADRESWGRLLRDEDW